MITDRLASRDVRLPRLRELPADTLALGVVAIALLAFFLVLYPVRGYRFPIGSDAPVYLWWARLAGRDGLSAVGLRPGVPALSLVIGGALPLSLSQVLAGLGAALAAATGLASAAFVMLAEGRERLHWLVPAAAGLLAGTFAAHLADGYLANLAFAALFIAAAALLTRRGNESLAAAALLLAAGGLTHPLFLLLGAAILGVAAGAAFLQRLRATRVGRSHSNSIRSEPVRIVIAVAAAGAIAAVGLALLSIGAGPVATDTSKDAFLRRAGLTDVLRHLYRVRFGLKWGEYLLPIAVPLAAVGLARARGSARRLLGSWLALTAVGVGVALATGIAPPERFLGFAFALPLLVALALVWLWSRFGDRSAGRLVVVGAAAAMVAAPLVIWSASAQFFTPLEVRRAGDAARVAAATAPGTPLVFVVDDGGRHLPFNVPRWSNVLRSAVPPSRIRDVHLYVGSPRRYLEGRPTLKGHPVRDSLSRLYLHDIREADGRPVAFVVAPMNRPGLSEARALGDRVSPGVFVLGSGPVPAPGPAADPLEPSSPWMLMLAGVAAFFLLGAVGYGWARGVVGGSAVAVGLAPAFGAAGLILGGCLVDLVGISLRTPAAVAVSAGVAAGGYALSFRRHGRGDGLERGAPPDSAPKVLH